MDELQQEGWQLFMKLCLKIEDENQLNELFRFVFTPEECDQLATRALLVRELLNKQPQRKIAADLKISISKITRGSNGLKRITPELKKYLLDVFCAE